MASVIKRKSSAKNFKLFNKGKLDFNFPLSCNLIPGYSDRDFKLEERVKNRTKLNYNISVYE